MGIFSTYFGSQLRFAVDKCHVSHPQKTLILVVFAGIYKMSTLLQWNETIALLFAG